MLYQAKASNIYVDVVSLAGEQHRNIPVSTSFHILIKKNKQKYRTEEEVEEKRKY